MNELMQRIEELLDAYKQEKIKVYKQYLDDPKQRLTTNKLADIRTELLESVNQVHDFILQEINKREQQAWDEVRG